MNESGREHDDELGRVPERKSRGSVRLLSALQGLLTRELGGIPQYVNASILASKAQGVAVAGQIMDIAKSEMRHAELLTERIDFLGGNPIMAPGPMVTGLKDIDAIAAVGVATEYSTEEAYAEAIQIATDENDITTKEMLKSILADEEEHAYFFEQIGGTAIGPADPPDGLATKGAKMRERKYLDVPFEVKSVDEETGAFTGYAAVFNNVDLGGDVIVPGAFKRTLDHSKGRMPILWFHDPRQPVGIGVAATEDAKGLAVEGQLDLNTERGRDMLSGLKMGYIDCMSIGYEVPKGGSEVKSGVRYLKELILPEYSLLTKGFSMNPEALVTGVKAVADFATELAEAQAQADLREQRWQIEDAFRAVLDELSEDESMTPDEKVGALRASFAQYTEAYCAWFAAWLAADVDDDDDEVYCMSRNLAALSVKVGRRNSGADAMTIKECIAKLQSLIDSEEAPEGDDAAKAKSLDAPGSHTDARADEPTAPATDPADDDSAAKEADIERTLSVLKLGIGN